MEVRIPSPVFSYYITRASANRSLRLIQVDINTTYRHQVKQHSPVYRVSQEEGTKLRESVPYVKIYRYNSKHLYPKLNGYGDNGQRKVWFSGGSTHCTLSANSVPHVCPRLPCQITEIPLTLLH